VTWALPGPATLLRPQHVLCQISRHGGPLSRSRPGPGRQPACGVAKVAYQCRAEPDVLRVMNGAGSWRLFSGSAE
jgi:hypothetical protein